MHSIETMSSKQEKNIVDETGKKYCRRKGKIILSTKREEFHRRRTEKFYQLVLMSRRNGPEPMNDMQSNKLISFLCLIRHTGSKSIDMFSCKDDGGNRLSNSTRNQQKQKL